MSKTTDKLLAAGVVFVGLIVSFILGLWGYMSTTAVTFYPSSADVPSIVGSAPPDEWASAVESSRQAVRAGLSQQNLPGISVAVGVNGHIAWSEGFGWADVDRKTSMAPSTLMRIGTASVVLSSAGAGLLLERGRLHLDDEIHKWVPEYWAHPWQITLRQLMGHMAGVPNDGGDEGPLYSRHCQRAVEGLQFLSGYERELRFQPGTDYRYSSYGWMLVSAAIEAAADEPFATFMQKAVFDPLGMRDTLTDDAAMSLPARATHYFPRFAADPHYGFDVTRETSYSCYGGANIFVSTPSDLVRFGMGVNAGRLLKPDTVQLLQTSLRLPSGEETGYGLGWDLEQVTLNGSPAVAIGHDGTTFGGMVASLMTFRDKELAVAVISNAAYADTAAVALKIAEAFTK
jgi:CubicO group peptidase (beta-lactamase class C family)